MSDLISREHMKSLGATCIASRSKDGNMFPIVSIDELPSVQPEIIRCKDCKWCSEHYDTDGNVPYWVCINWDAGTDADGFCHEAELRGEQDG